LLEKIIEQVKLLLIIEKENGHQIANIFGEEILIKN